MMSAASDPEGVPLHPRPCAESKLDVLHSLNYIPFRVHGWPPRSTVAAREEHIAQLQQQIRLLGDSETMRAGEQRAHLASLISSFNDLRASCEQQVRHLVRHIEAWASPHTCCSNTGGCTSAPRLLQRFAPGDVMPPNAPM
jgi:hypothetical protein